MRILLPLCLLLCLCATANAATSGDIRLKAGVYINPPFVVRNQDGTYGGMVMDLWQMISERVGIATTFHEFKSIDRLTQALAHGEVDVALFNSYVTPERAAAFNLTFPWGDAGDRILVNHDIPPSVYQILKKEGQIRVYVGICIVLSAAAALNAYFRKKYDPEFPEKWHDGLAMSLYQILLMARSGRIELKFLGWMGYLVSSLWLLFGIALVAYVTSSITTAMATSVIRPEITSIHDIADRTVGVFAGGPNAKYLQQMRINNIAYDSFEEMTIALEEGEIGAVVADNDTIQYWLHRHPQANMEAAGAIFNDTPYAFMLNRSHTELNHTISEAIVYLYNAPFGAPSAIEQLRHRYFGSYE